MIQIESVQIRELRGIRELKIKPNRKNFVVSGPNGSGKSGVVDAIQFALTGEMSRLTGKGTGGLSVHRHGPHVDRRDDPAAAEVSLRFYVPELEKSAVLTRNVKNSRKVQLEPNDPEIRAVIEEVAVHPELTLSRREIIKYIIVEAGQRSKELQALLKLEEIGQTRGVLKTVSNKLSIELGHAQRAVNDADDAFRRHLDLTSLARDDILAVVNPYRRTLGLAELADLSADTDLSAGVLEGTGQASFNKESALRDVAALETAELGLASLGKEEVARLLRDLATLEDDPALVEAVTRRSFIESGLALVQDRRCPLCDTEWEDDALKEHLRAKLAKAGEAETVQERLLESGAQIARQAHRITGLVEAVQPFAATDGSEGSSAELEAWSNNLRAFAEELDTVEKIAAQRERFETGWPVPPSSLRQRLAALKATVQAKPDQSASVAAQTFLTRAQDRFATCQSARRDEKRAATAVEAGRAVYNAYCDVADAYLSALYEAVEDDFAAYYRAINAEDEGEFSAKLDPAEGGLDLEVAFYDKGMFPPGAYHSEGHQDGMGVCLYLALMKRLLGDQFQFAVLDDVVMSVDQGHRKEFCRLLKTHFPDAQFIITTHDKVWAKQMQTEGLVDSQGGVAFHSWSVQTGPIVEQAADVWDQIEADVARGDIDVASGRLRRHMEYVTGELADELGAKPTYRGYFSYDLGDLLSAVIGRHGELLKLASKAANSWDDESAKAGVEALMAVRSEALERYGGEAWVVNKALHWNDWANFSKAEFREVVEAFKGLLVQLRCAKPECNSWLHVTPKRGDPESFRCRCEAVSFNLTARQRP